MKKANFTLLLSRMHAIGRLTLLVLGVLSYAYSANAQGCNVGCNDDINVTLKGDCSAPVTPDMLLEGYECASVGLSASDFKITILDDDEDDKDLNGKGQKIYEIKLKSSAQAELADDHPLKKWPGCWGYITGEDKTGPWIDCPSTIDELNGVDLLCDDVNDAAILAALEGPEYGDNCGPATLSGPKDSVSEDGDCGKITLYRTWTVTDGEGKKAECTQKVKFERPSLGGDHDDVDYPTKEVHVECDFVQVLLDGYADDDVDDANDDLTEADLLNADGHPTPLALELLGYVGYPSITSANGRHLLDDSYCNIGASYDDISEIDVCANTIKIVRQWTVIDWCYIPGQDALNNSPLINHRQIIKFGDTTPPVVEDPGTKVTVSTGPFGCEASYKIPGVTYEDNCSATGTVSATLHRKTVEPVVDRYGKPTGATRDVWTNLGSVSVGQSMKLETDAWYTIKYTVTDACGNTSDEVDLDVDVEDTIEPVAVCDDDLHISVGGDGIGRVTAGEVNEGSWDNCGTPDVYVSRKLASDDVRDDYLDQVYNGLTFADLVLSGLSESNWEASADNSSDAAIYVVDEDEDGAWDATELHEVLRLKDGMWYTWWRAEVWFICADVNERVVIELLAVDSDDNTNVCWNDVLIEDKVAPTCHAPGNINWDCTELPYGFDPNDDAQLSDLFGDATGTDNCNATATQISKTVAWECNSGKITRTFQATDDQLLVSLNSCTQTITISRVHEYEIIFPKDPAPVQCVEHTDGELETTIVGCDLLSINATNERFTASGDACYKIKRTYKVINWCEYDGEALPVVISRDEDKDGVTGEHDVYVLRDAELTAGYNVYIDDDSNEKDAPLRRTVSTGYWTYIQFIKVQDITPPVITLNDYEVFCSYNNEDCDALVAFNFSVSDVCAEPDVTVKAFVLPDGDASSPIAVTVTGDVATGYSISTRLPIGNHVLEIHALDGCRNSALLKADFIVADCKAPTPICINGLAIELMPTEDGGGAMVIWASDFTVSGLGEDCSEDVTLSINRLGDTPDRESLSITVTCDDIETLPVEIYAWDSANNPLAVQPDGTVGGPNYDHCETYVLLQDNMFGVCAGPGAIGVAGLITNEENETVENVQVNLTGGTALSTTTVVNGSYNFSGLTRGNDYTITPVKNDDYLNGVSTFDLVLITKHILGSKKLDSPYKLIAADANNSGSVSAVDLIQFRKLVLSINRTLANNSSWRFIPASYQFPDANNPWATQFPEILNYNDLQSAIATGDFVAVKLGDVNGNARANSALNDQRTLAGVFNLNVKDQEVVAGNEYRVSFTAADLNVQGYQFTMNLNGLELVDIEYGVAKAENFGLVEEGVITTSWNGTANSSDLFTLVVRANATAQLSELLSVNSRYTVAEAYNTADELMDVALTFNGQAVAVGGFELYQNTPNPFQGQTVIGFTLPTATQATIKIHDVTGKTLKMVRGEYAKGFNQINLNSSDLPAVGVLYYTLETDEFTSTKKMIVLGE